MSQQSNLWTHAGLMEENKRLSAELAKAKEALQHRDDEYELVCDELKAAQHERDEARNVWFERLATERENALAMLKHLGYEPDGTWDIAKSAQCKLRTPGAVPASFEEVVAAILEGLTQEGVPAWYGDGVSIVAQIVWTQVERANAAQSLAAQREKERDVLREALHEIIGLDHHNFAEESRTTKIARSALTRESDGGKDEE